jgi:glutathione-regulated potassium-efflux system ancillary protein KefC
MQISDPLYVDAIWLSMAFVCGLIVRRIGLPPLIGFLLAGLIINSLDLHQGRISDVLQWLSDLGVMLLLFTIGLKIKIKTLMKPEIWSTATIHMLIVVIFIGGLIFLLSSLGLHHFTDLNFGAALLVGFALSFSSTVFVVKTLEGRGEFNSFHGKIAIGILIMQDIFAVVFMTFVSDYSLSLWILTLPALLFIIRWALSKTLSFLDHGELVTVFGFFATFIAGALSFSLIGLKPDLGALVIGMLLVNHPRADELYDRMMNYKDFFLIAFFMNIGMTAVPSSNVIVVSLILLPLILLKSGLFLLILARFNLRARTAFLTSLSLGNFSEFGLIVGLTGVQAGIITENWLIIIALLMSLSFILSAPLNARAHQLFDKNKKHILLLNRSTHYIDIEPNFLGDANHLVIGMGSVGLPAYQELDKRFPGKVIGIDYNHEKVERMQKEKVNAIWGDATDSEFWENVNLTKITMVYLTMSDYASNINSLNEIKKLKAKPFKISAICHFPDESFKYRKNDVDFIYDYKANLGLDLVEHTLVNLTDDK